MDKDLILWASFFHDMGKLLQKCEWLNTDVTDRREALKKFLNGKSREQKWFPQLFGKDFNHLFLLSYYSHEGDIQEGKSGTGPDDSILPYVKMIARADQLSGWKRQNKENENIGLHRERLISIFSNVSIQGEHSKENYFLPLVPLSEKETVFPVPQSEPGKTDEEFETLLTGFLEELRVYINNKDKPDFDTFYFLAQKYLWCIPAPHFDTNPDVSLFEHLKTTAAIAAILYDTAGKEEFALVGFDISGIQEFIYTIASKGAAKSFKGRSFYLQLLEMAVSTYVLETLSLPLTNIVYTGGGKGFFLAPASRVKKLPDIEKSVNTFLFENTDTKVFVGLECVTFGPEGFKQFNRIMERLLKKLDNKKKQKFSSIIDEKYEKLFEPSRILADELDTCSICGKEERPERVDEDGVRWCKQCDLFKNLGRHLREAAAIIETTGNNGEKNTGAGENCIVDFSFGDFNCTYRFLTGKDLEKAGTNGEMLYCLNDTELFSRQAGKNKRTGFLFIAGNQVPTKDDPAKSDLMDFTDIADCSDGGAKKLGVVRGDVDNLGVIFARGMGQRSSLGRISQLSFLLKHFFSAGANLVFTPERKEFIVYSGGDDFFVIGPWNRLIDDLIIFREKFERYTCSNPTFSFSASFSIFGSRYPAFKFAEVAGNREKRAKENTSDGREKNSIVFLNKAAFWEDFSRLRDLQEMLVDLVDRKIFNKSYIQLLQRIAQYNSLGNWKPKTESELMQSALYHRWKWYYAWQAARLAERHKYKHEVQIPLKHIYDFLFSSIYKEYRFINDDSLYLIEIPARWAELRTRK